ncbi:MAG TPA: multidrug effflux MFS transporter [Cellulomonas sp.]
MSPDALHESRVPSDAPLTLPSHADVSGPLLLTLGLLAAFAPFAMDMYLPAFPGMTADLGTSAVGVQLSLTAFLAGAGAGQLVFGPLSDRYGRRTPLLVGAALCVVASLAAALAPSIAVLVAARVAQGLSGAAGMVIGRAVISDLARGRAAARAFSLLMLVGSVAPVVAPLAGSVLVEHVGWRGVLMVVTGIAVVMLVSAARVVPESHPPAARVRPPRAAQAGRTPLLSVPFLAWTLALCLSFSAMMAYIAASPFLFQVTLGLSAVGYALMFGGTALLLVLSGAVASRLAVRTAPVSTITAGIGAMLAGSVAFAMLVAADTPPLWFAVPLLVVVPSLGLVMGNGTALALGSLPRAAGTGSAVIGAVQFGLAALTAPLVGLGGDDTAGPLAAVLVVTTALALGACLIGRRRG